MSSPPLQTPHLPAREKREEEIKEYRRRVAEGGGMMDQPNDIAERQPMFLKDKGDALFAKGNFEAAVAAYSRGIELDDTIPVLFSNRAACHLKMRMFANCVDDCDRALALLPEEMLAGSDDLEPAIAAATAKAMESLQVRDTVFPGVKNVDEVEGKADDEDNDPLGGGKGGDGAGASGAVEVQDEVEGALVPAAAGPVGTPTTTTTTTTVMELTEEKKQAIATRVRDQAEKGRRMAVKLLCRRARARVTLGQTKPALDDLQHAQRLDPDNAEIARSIEDMEMSMGSSDFPSLMDVGARRYRGRDLEGALEAFSLALAHAERAETTTSHAPSPSLSSPLSPSPSPEVEVADVEAEVMRSDDRATALVARAAVLLQLNRFHLSAEDCSAALQSLVTTGRAQGLGSEDDASRTSTSTNHATPTSTTTARAMDTLREMRVVSTWGVSQGNGVVLIKALARRGAAYGHLRMYREAGEDFQTLAGLYAEAGLSERAQAAAGDAMRMDRLAREETKKTSGNEQQANEARGRNASASAIH